MAQFFYVIPTKAGRCCMANNLPYYGYYKYGVIPRPLPRYPEKALIKRPDAVVKQLDDTETLCKHSSHATMPMLRRNDIKHKNIWRK
ncbi:hypothetical protein [Rickettsia endosymbiont of Orchestes rusci]|uniref:hypothetical protein n=1 Tax=Rickettsia endosymbiont of Orchestes rusci TaxID=3066250 RepID=UPI00313A9DEF